MKIKDYKKSIPLKKLKKSLDVLWAELVKMRDGQCVKCGKRDRLNAHHIFSRSKTSTRFDLDNGITFCQGHHYFGIHKWHESYTRRFIIPRLGKEKYELLYQKSNSIQKCDRDFLESKMTELQQYRGSKNN